MTPPTKTVRVSAEARDQLIRLKRFTRIDQWNILCRWALCRSLAEEHPPSPTPIKEWSNVEMSWAVFAGSYGDALLLLLRQRAAEQGLSGDEAAITDQLRLHLHRGIATLAAAGEEVRAIEDLVTLAR